MYENSVKVPFIVSHPGRIPAGRVSEAMVSQYDFMPTLLDYLRLPDPNDDMSPGRSFLPALSERRTTPGRRSSSSTSTVRCA